MKTFKIQYLNKEGSLKEISTQADSESAARKSILEKTDFDMIISCLKVEE
jgi:type II secretory pathway component PulF